jgi:hypothetical protein
MRSRISGWLTPRPTTPRRLTVRFFPTSPVGLHWPGRGSRYTIMLRLESPTKARPIFAAWVPNTSLQVQPSLANVWIGPAGPSLTGQQAQLSSNLRVTPNS